MKEYYWRYPTIYRSLKPIRDYISEGPVAVNIPYKFHLKTSVGYRMGDGFPSETVVLSLVESFDNIFWRAEVHQFDADVRSILFIFPPDFAVVPSHIPDTWISDDALVGSSGSSLKDREIHPLNIPVPRRLLNNREYHNSWDLTNDNLGSVCPKRIKLRSCVLYTEEQRLSYVEPSSRETVFDSVLPGSCIDNIYSFLNEDGYCFFQSLPLKVQDMPGFAVLNKPSLDAVELFDNLPKLCEKYGVNFKFRFSEFSLGIVSSIGCRSIVLNMQASHVSNSGSHVSKPSARYSGYDIEQIIISVLEREFCVPIDLKLFYKRNTFNCGRTKAEILNIVKMRLCRAYCIPVISSPVDKKRKSVDKYYKNCLDRVRQLVGTFESKDPVGFIPSMVQEYESSKIGPEDHFNYTEVIRNRSLVETEKFKIECEISDLRGLRPVKHFDQKKEDAKVGFTPEEKAKMRTMSATELSNFFIEETKVKSEVKSVRRHVKTNVVPEDKMLQIQEKMGLIARLQKEAKLADYMWGIEDYKEDLEERTIRNNFICANVKKCNDNMDKGTLKKYKSKNKSACKRVGDVLRTCDTGNKLAVYHRLKKCGKMSKELRAEGDSSQSFLFENPKRGSEIQKRNVFSKKKKKEPVKTRQFSPEVKSKLSGDFAVALLRTRFHQMTSSQYKNVCSRKWRQIPTYLINHFVNQRIKNKPIYRDDVFYDFKNGSSGSASMNLLRRLEFRIIDS